MNTAKKPFNSKDFNQKVTKIFDFLLDIWGIFVHTISNLFMFLWNASMSLILGFSTLVAKVCQTFSLELMAGVWILVAVVVCIVTLGGWWIMGGLSSVALNERFNVEIDYTVACAVSMLVGFLLNGQQVKMKLWTMKQNSAAIWHKNSGGKVNVEAASTDYKKFLTAKAKKDTYSGMFLEFLIQIAYAMVLKLDIFVGGVVIAFALFVPEIIITQAALKLNEIKFDVYGLN